MTSENTREHARVEVTRRCWCESGSTAIYAQIGNLSEGGVFVRTFAPLGEGVRARLRWDLDLAGEEIEAEAVVVWRRPGNGDPRPAGMGLRFEGISEAARSRIRSFVSERLDA